MQSHLLPPEAWRSEAFAEDLFDAGHAAPEYPSADRKPNRLLLSVVPVVLVLAGALALGLGLGVA